MARSAAQDPLEKFRFLVDWSGTAGNAADGSEDTARSRAGFHDMQMPKRSTSKIMYREGNSPDINSLSAGLSTMEDITLSRGLIVLNNESGNEFYKWMSAVHNPQKGHDSIGDGTNKRSGTGTENFAASEYRKDVTITMLDRTGAIARKWRLYEAFPVNFVPGSDLDASEDGEKSLEQLTLAYEDFQELLLTSDEAVTVSTSL